MSEIGRDIGFTATTVNNIARGQTKPGFDVIQALALNYPNLNLRWLITGKNDPLSPEVHERTDEELEDIIEEIRTDIERIKKRLNKLDNQ